MKCADKNYLSKTKKYTHIRTAIINIAAIFVTKIKSQK